VGYAKQMREAHLLGVTHHFFPRGLVDYAFG